MLSIAKLRLAGADYFLATVAQGTEEYYSEHGDAPGRWIASSTKTLGLSGEVSGDELRIVLAGVAPFTGEALASPRRTVPGFDLCFSPPKSVSLLFIFGNASTSRAVVTAHDRAVAAALDYMEREACRVRRGHAGARRVMTDGFVAAMFRHRTSRAIDPQLHTHVLVANAARGIDGRWSALDGHLLFRHAKTAGYLYQSHLRHELTRLLGVRWGPVVSGSAELKGVPRDVIQAFSKRRKAIKEELAGRGITSRRGAEIATLATRSPKEHDWDFASMRRAWEREAASLGFGPVEFRALVGEAVEPASVALDRDDLAESLTLSSSSFDRLDVIQAVAERAETGATVEEIEARSHDFLASDHVVRLTDATYTTPQMLRLERGVVDNVQRRTSGRFAVVETSVVDNEIGKRWRLSNEQAEMVRGLVTWGNGVDVVLGVAGSGKTSALECARSAWAAGGCQVVGAAIAARAARELQAQSGIPSGTLDALLRGLDEGQVQLMDRAVIVVDEAGMVDTRRLARLLVHADAARAKVVLVGDDQQLPEIEVGGAFSSLVRRLPVFVLAENRRQRDPDERRALTELRTGNAAAAVERMITNGRIAFVESIEGAREQMVRDWMKAHFAGEDVVMLAFGRADVRELNALARAQLGNEGGIKNPEQLFAVGDRVMALSNRKRLGIVNGARGSVVADDGGPTVRFDDGTTVDLPPSYIDAGHLAHAYASTIHKAQGMSCDRAFVLGSGALFREAGYTALSRGRKENRLYVVAPEPPDVDVGHGVYGARDDPIDNLVRALEHSQRKHLAIDRLVRASPSRMPEPDAPSIGIEP